MSADLWLTSLRRLLGWQLAPTDETSSVEVGTCRGCRRHGRVLYRGCCYTCAPAAWREGLRAVLPRGEELAHVAGPIWP